MKILIHSINFSPELTGVGKYTGEMAMWLATRGHDVRVVTAPPYYPQWKVAAGHKNSWSVSCVGFTCEGAVESQAKLTVFRCPIWVPKKPSGLKRLLHLASFAVSSFPIMVSQILWRPDIVWVVEPPLFCSPQALLIAKFSGAKAWLHVQDFEVDAAFDLGLLKARWLRRIVLCGESVLMRAFDQVSTISVAMYQLLLDKGISQSHVQLFPNWVDAEAIFYLSTSNFREELNIQDDVIVALYSGNMGEKQGLEIVIEAARACEKIAPNLKFVLCGDGAVKFRMQVLAEGLSNVLWLPLQPLERLNELLNLANIHLLPQRADVADLVLPSKLTGMLASGRPVLATAHEGTELARLVSSCGLVVDPGNLQAFLNALLQLATDSALRDKLGQAARRFAESNLAKNSVLMRFEQSVVDLSATTDKSKELLKS